MLFPPNRPLFPGCAKTMFPRVGVKLLASRRPGSFATHAALLASALFVGLSQVAYLPPFEGFDETAHYSYIQQIAEARTLPRFGDRMSADVDEYLAVAPAADSLHGRWAYKEFFASTPATIEAGRAAVRGSRTPRNGWRPGAGANWEAQHPPLYYLMMAPVYLSTKGWSLAGRLFLMRCISYLFAWGGLCGTVLWASRSSGDPRMRSTTLSGLVLWPFIIPAWFPEMARLGSDSLVVPLAAGAWILLQSCERGGIPRHGILGVVCGLGLLTKATFIPFAAVISAFLIFRAFVDGKMRFVVTFHVAMLAVAAWWYAGVFLETGSPFTTNDSAALKGSSLVGQLIEHGSFRNFLTGIAYLGLSFAWSGTWSLVMPPLPSLILLMPLLMSMAVAYLAAASGRSPDPIAYVPPLTLAVFAAGLIYHMLIMLAVMGIAGTGAWYLHAFVPVLAPMVGVAIAELSKARARPALPLMLCYPLLFLPLAVAIQALFFAGCGTKDRSYFDLSSAASCAADLTHLYSNLAVLSSPGAAMTLFVVGWVAAMIAMANVVRAQLAAWDGSPRP